MTCHQPVSPGWMRRKEDVFEVNSHIKRSARLPILRGAHVEARPPYEEEGQQTINDRQRTRQPCGVTGITLYKLASNCIRLFRPYLFVLRARADHGLAAA